MNKNEMMPEDEISLFDFLKKLREIWKAIVVGLATGIACAVLGIFLIPPKYQAREVIQAGKVAGTEIEAPQVMVERIKSPAFAVDVAKRLGDQKLLDLLLTGEDTGVLGMKVNIIRGTSLIEVVAESMSSAVALKKIEVANELLLARYEKQSLPLREKLTRDIQLAQERLDATELELTKLEKIIPPIKSMHDYQFAPIALLAIQNTQKRAELLDLKRQLVSLQMLQLPPSTQPPSPIEQAFAGTMAVTPKKSLLLALGIIGGLLGGVGWGLVSNNFSRKIGRKKLAQHESIA